MKQWIIAACVGVVATCGAIKIKSAVAPASTAGAKPDAGANGKLIIHEWGTFTSFAGSDGVQLPFNTTIGSDLPDFVMSRAKAAAKADPEVRESLQFIKAGGAAALVRMETPVLYFYSDTARDLSVKVNFPDGLLTEFYPPVREMAPKYGLSPGEFSRLTPTAASISEKKTPPASDLHFADSFLDWGQIRIIPHPTADEAKTVPAVVRNNHYGFARDTDSNLVQYQNADGSRVGEKFLFYRGLGNFIQPATAVALGNDHFDLRTNDQSPIESAFIIERPSAEHAQARFAKYDHLKVAQPMSLSATASSDDELSSALERSLVAAGLYEKEAKAMVATWKDSWLDEPGTRVLYIVPRAATDAMLPLHFSTAPDESARVFVGRIDLLTPELEAKLKTMLAAATETGTIPVGDARMLKSLDRFMWPALEHMSKLAGDAKQVQATRLYRALSRTLVEPNR